MSARRGRFDARAYWRSLRPETQREIGEAALLLWMALAGQHGNHRWMHASEEAELLLDARLPDPAEYSEGPDLAAIGIRACRVCGCTDNSGCAEGCEWVEQDLCSACATPGAGVSAS